MKSWRDRNQYLRISHELVRLNDRRLNIKSWQQFTYRRNFVKPVERCLFRCVWNHFGTEVIRETCLDRRSWSEISYFLLFFIQKKYLKRLTSHNALYFSTDHTPNSQTNPKYQLSTQIYSDKIASRTYPRVTLHIESQF